MLTAGKLSLSTAEISYISKESSSAESTIIFIHGFPFTKEMWKDQLQGLSSGFNAIAYDVRGFGESTTSHPFFSIELFAKDLIEFIKQLNLQKVILCGLSMGGYIALRAVEISPELFSGLILSDTNSSADSDENKLGRFKSIEKIVAGGKETFANEFLKKVLHEQTFESKPQVPAFIKNMILSLSVNTICATQLALASRTDTTAFLNKISVPALIIRGKHDLLMEMEQAEVLKSNLRAGEFVEIPDSAHLPNLENPLLFNRELNLFLQRHFPA